MWLVFLKELKELLRDRKTLFFMIALPILIMPVIFGIVLFIASQAVEDAQEKVHRYAIIGEQYAPEIDKKIKEIEQFERVGIEVQSDYSEIVSSGEVDFVLVIPENYSETVLQSGQARVELYLNDAGLNLVFSRVEKVVKEQNKALQKLAFQSLGFNENQQAALLQPVVLEKINIADDRENLGQKIGGLAPYFIFILCLQGAMFPATDLAAGEKERGTLETLLISPIERYKLVLGKFFTVAFAGVTAALLTVSSIAIWGFVASRYMPIDSVINFMASIGVIDFVLMFFMLIPVAAIFSSVLLSLSIYARSFKEAQSYMGSLVIFVIIPIILAALPGVELKGGWAWVPLTNVALAIKELIKGTMDYFQLVAIFASTVLIAVALLAFCVHWFNKEKVLFR